MALLLVPLAIPAIDITSDDTVEDTISDSNDIINGPINGIMNGPMNGAHHDVKGNYYVKKASRRFMQLPQRSLIASYKKHEHTNL